MCTNTNFISNKHHIFHHFKDTILDNAFYLNNTYYLKNGRDLVTKFQSQSDALVIKLNYALKSIHRRIKRKQFNKFILSVQYGLNKAAENVTRCHAEAIKRQTVMRFSYTKK